MIKYEWTNPGDDFYFFPTRCYSDFDTKSGALIRYFSWLWFHWCVIYTEIEGE